MLDRLGYDGWVGCEYKPLTTTEAGLQRRAVAKLGKLSRGIVNKGVFVLRESATQARAIRTSDGLGWAIAGEPEIPMMDAAWVNEDAIWLFTSYIQPNEPGYPQRGGMIELGRSALGSPTIPSGL